MPVYRVPIRTVYYDEAIVRADSPESARELARMVDIDESITVSEAEVGEPVEIDEADAERLDPLSMSPEELRLAYSDEELRRLGLIEDVDESTELEQSRLDPMSMDPEELRHRYSNDELRRLGLLEE